MLLLSIEMIIFVEGLGPSVFQHQFSFAIPVAYATVFEGDVDLWLRYYAADFD